MKNPFKLIKPMLRNWLEIKDPIVISDIELRHLICRAIEDLLNDYENVGIYKWNSSFDSRQWVKRTIEKYCHENTKTLVSTETRNVVNSEKFLDEIVARLRNKQLSQC